MNIPCPSCGKPIESNPSFGNDTVAMVCGNCVNNWERYTNTTEAVQDAQDGRKTVRLVGGSGDGDDEPVSPPERVFEV
jgi:hypothetical protein